MNIIVDKFEYGDIACISNYDIFSPAPCAWNTEYNGNGKEYKPSSTYEVTSDLYLYGQYKDSFVNYYYFDRTVDRWQTRFGTMIVIGNYLSNNVPLDNFKCWLCEGKEVQIDQSYSLSTFNLDLFPSCCTSVQISFDPNGGAGQTIKSKNGKCSQYMQRTNDRIDNVIIPFAVSLPACTYTKKYYHFNGWKIKDKVYNAEEIYNVSSDITAIAQWRSDKKYQIDLRLQLDNRISEQEDFGNVEILGTIYDKKKTLKAIPKDGYSFDYWSGDIQDNTNNTIDIECNKSTTLIIAHFRRIINYRLQVNIYPTGFGSATVEETDVRNVKNVTAIANYGKVFSKWNGVPVEKERQNPLTYVFESESEPEKTIEAIFEKDPSYTYIYRGNDCQIKSIDGLLSNADLERTNIEIEDYSITSVDIGNTITAISDNCFKNCKKLEKINLRNVVSFGIGSFANSGLTSIVIPNEVSYVSENMFENCSNLQNVKLEKTDTLQTIRSNAFRNCTSLVNITNYDGNNNVFCGHIEEHAFYNCQNLRTIKFKNGLNSIGDHAFHRCSKLNLIDLTEIKSPDNIRIQDNTFDSIYLGTDKRTFQFDSKETSQLFSNNEKWEKYISDFEPCPLNQQTIIEINILKLRDNKVQYAFSGDYSSKIPSYERKPIEWGDDEPKDEFVKLGHIYKKTGRYTIVIPNMFSRISFDINSDAILDYYNLVNIKQIGSNVEAFKDRAFRRSSISEISIPYNVKKIGIGIFSKCTNLDITKINIQDGKILADSWGIFPNNSLINLFNEDTKTENLIIPDGVKTIEKNCFATCSKLKTINLPASVEQISENAFGQNTKDIQLTVDPNNPFYKIVDNALVDHENNVIVGFNSSYINEGIKELKDGAFSYCNKKQNYVFPSTLEKIGNYCFSNNTSLKTVDFSNTKYQTVSQIENDYNLWFVYCAGFTYDINSPVLHSSIQIKTRQENTVFHSFSNPQYDAFYDSFNEKVFVVIAANESDLVGTSRDADDLETIMKAYSSNITKLKNRDATTQNVKNAINQAKDSANCDLLIFFYSGHGGNSSGRQYMCLHDRNFYDYEFWPLIADAQCRVMCIFDCCHAGSMFRLNVNDKNIEKVNLDFGQSAKKFFSNSSKQSNGLFSASNSGPKLLVWSACSESEVSWCLTQSEYNQGGIWKDTINRVGHCFFLQMLLKINSTQTYSEVWNEINSGDENTNYAKANQHRIEYDGDIKKFHNEHPSSEWDQWVGPTPSKTNLNVFDENMKCFK